MDDMAELLVRRVEECEAARPAIDNQIIGLVQRQAALKELIGAARLLLSTALSEHPSSKEIEG